MPKERISDLKLEKEANNTSNGVLSKEVGLRFIEILILSLMSMIFNTSFSLVLYTRFNANPFIIGTIMAVSAAFVMLYGLVFMKRLIMRIGEKKMFFMGLGIFIIGFFIYPYLIELWMLYIFVIPFSFASASIGPLISTNITKAIGPDKQGALSGWTTNLQAISQIISPLIATSFLYIGGIMIGFIFINSYQLIGFTNVILGIILMIIVILDIRHYPYLYSYEKIRKKQRALQKQKKQEEKKKRKNKEEDKLSNTSIKESDMNEL